MLEKPRNEIDKIDAELVKLFERRMNAVTEIGNIKKANNLPIFDASREDVVIQKAQSRLENPEYNQAIAEFFTQLMAVTKSCQQKIISQK